MAARRTHKKWLDDYLKFASESSESPQSYHLWSGISIVAGTLQRRVWMRRAHSIIYPNMYIILIGPSGISRKGEPLMVARSFMERIHIPLLPNNSSKESIVMDMNEHKQQYKDETTGKIHMHCSVSGVSEELANFLGMQDTGMISFMTEWYDSRDKFEKKTKHQGFDEVDGVCFNFLSSADPTWLPSVFPKEAPGGGFMSRVIFVVEDKKRRSIPNPDIYPISERLRETLTADLEIMLTLTGEYRFDKAAQARHDRWYMEHDEDYNNRTVEMRGYGGRRETHLRKISMVLSACRSNDMIITEDDFSMAVEYLTALEPRMPEVYRGMVNTKYGKETDMILDFLREVRSATRATILNTFTSHIDSEVLDFIAKDLVARQLIQDLIIPGQGAVLKIID